MWSWCCCVTGTDDDLEYYVRECGDILGVTHNLPQDNRTAKHVLEHIFAQIVEFKKLNQVRASLGLSISTIAVLSGKNMTFASTFSFSLCSWLFFIWCFQSGFKSFGIMFLFVYLPGYLYTHYISKRIVVRICLRSHGDMQLQSACVFPQQDRDYDGFGGLEWDVPPTAKQICDSPHCDSPSTSTSHTLVHHSYKGICGKHTSWTPNSLTRRVGLR